MIPWPILMLKGKSVLVWAKAHILIVLFAALAIYAFTLYLQRNRARADARSNALALDSAQAAAAVTIERTEANVRKVLGDSIRAFERRTIQAVIERDAMDRAFHRLSISRSNIVVTIDTVRAAGEATVTENADVRRSIFTVRQEPITATAAVALPAPPLLGTIDAKFVIDPIHLGVRLQCGEPVRGIKPATIVVTTPPWMKAEIQGTEQKPELCNPLLGDDSHRGVSKWWIPVAAVLGIGVWEGVNQALDKK